LVINSYLKSVMSEDSFVVCPTILSEELRPAEAGSRRFDTFRGYKPSRTVWESGECRLPIR